MKLYSLLVKTATAQFYNIKIHFMKHEMHNLFQFNLRRYTHIHINSVCIFHTIYHVKL